MKNQSSLNAWQGLRVPLAISNLIGTLTLPIAKSQYFLHISKIMEQEATFDMPSKKGCRVRQSFVKPPTQLGLAINHVSSMLLPDWEKVTCIFLTLPKIIILQYKTYKITKNSSKLCDYITYLPLLLYQNNTYCGLCVFKKSIYLSLFYTM